jgi:hypothetical protein
MATTMPACLDIGPAACSSITINVQTPEKDSITAEV